MGSPHPYQQFGPFSFPALTTAQRDELTLVPGLTVWDTDLGTMVMFDSVEWSEYITRRQLPDLFDAVVDSDYAGTLAGVFTTLAAAIAAGAISIFIRKMELDTDLTIASADAVQRIQGKDADTTALPVSVTCNKGDVTFEQLWLTNALTIVNDSLRTTAIINCLISGGGYIVAAPIALLSIDGCRFYEPNTTPVRLGSASTSDPATITNCLFYANVQTPASFLTILSAFAYGPAISDCLFYSGATGVPSDYQVKQTAGVSSLRLALRRNMFLANQAGGVSLPGITKTIIDGNRFEQLLSLTAGRRSLNISSIAGVDINTTVSHNQFSGNAGTDVLFECASADADAAGLILANNTFVTGTILGSQDAVWIGNNMASCTIDFQSKTGIVVIGGDMTGATLQNIPTDLVFRNVKGQADRGTYTGGTWAADLLPDATATYDLGVTGTRWRDAWLSRNLAVGGTLGVTGAATLAAALMAGNLTFTDATYDIGASGATRPRDLFLSRNEVVGNDLTVGANLLRVLTTGGFGTIVSSLIQQGGYVATPSTVQTLAAGTALLANAEIVQINCAGAVTSTATPFIATPTGDGQRVTIINVDTADTFTISDQGTLAGSNLRLSTATYAMGPRDSITLVYNATIGDWIEVARTNVI